MGHREATQTLGSGALSESNPSLPQGTPRQDRTLTRPWSNSQSGAAASLVPWHHVGIKRFTAGRKRGTQTDLGRSVKWGMGQMGRDEERQRWESWGQGQRKRNLRVPSSGWCMKLRMGLSGLFRAWNLSGLLSRPWGQGKKAAIHRWPSLAFLLCVFHKARKTDLVDLGSREHPRGQK